MADPPKSLGDRLKEDIMDFCERMADVEAGSRNQYGGMPQQMHDAEDERRRLRKEAQKANEQGHQNNSNDDAGGDEHRENKDADKVDERRKNDNATSDPGVQSDKATKQSPKTRKDKPVDKGTAHETRNLQKRLHGHGKLALTSGKTLSVPEGGFQQMFESSSDEELQWITDRMMLGDLDEVPVGLGHSKTEMPKSSKTAEEPLLRLRGGAGGRNRYSSREYDDDDDDDDDNDEDHWNALRESARHIVRDRSQFQERNVQDYDEDYHNALREAARNNVKDRIQQKQKHVHFEDAKRAEEPRYSPFSNNSRAGLSTNYDFGRGARTSTFAGPSTNHDFGRGARTSTFAGPSTNHDFGRGARTSTFAGPSTTYGFGRGARTSTFTGPSSPSERQKHDGSQGLGFDESSGKNKGNRGPRLRFSGRGESSSGKNSGRKRGAGMRPVFVDSSDEESSDSGRQSRGKDRGERRPRNPSLSPSPTRAQNHESRRAKSGKQTSKDSESSFDEEGPSELENAVGHMPPDYYAILNVTPDCSFQEIKEAAKKMRIKTHPDKLKKEDMSAEEKAKIDEMAANVGQAAELLSDPQKRREYDRLVRRWQMRYGDRQRR